MKNKYQHNDDGTTYIFVESKNKYFPGKHAIIIDTEDWDKVKEHSWCITASEHFRSPYAKTALYVPFEWEYTSCSGKKCSIKLIGKRGLLLHHLIKGMPSSPLVIDHKNRNGLDNRKKNLLETSQRKNMLNRRINKNSSSGYWGVSWHKAARKWASYCFSQKNKKLHLGVFECKHEAASHRNEKILSDKLDKKRNRLNEVEIQ